MAAVWAIADLHLSVGNPDKKMDLFGAQWQAHSEKIEQHWRQSIDVEDLVLLPGDISWAMRRDQARLDMEWIASLPGKKVMIKGNHDYWWDSYSKVCKMLPPSLHAIQNNAMHFGDISIAGARLWDTTEYHFTDYINFVEMPESIAAKAKPDVRTVQQKIEEQEKIFARELQRLEMSLQQLKEDAHVRIAMTHYPPLDAYLNDSLASQLLKKYKVDICVFGHLHNIKKERSLFGKKEGTQYILTSCDYVDFKPIKLLECSVA